MPIMPERAELADEVVGEGLRAVELLGRGRDLAGGEVARGAADELVVGATGRSQHGRPFSQSRSLALRILMPSSSPLPTDQEYQPCPRP